MNGRQAKEARRRARRDQQFAEGLISQVPAELTRPDQNLFIETRPGVHRWASIATYTLTDDECLDAHAGRNIYLDLDHLANLAGPLCLICEQPWRTVANQPCAGDPDPSWRP